MYETDPLVRHEHKEVVAQGIAEIIFTEAVEALSWEDYPGIGEYDWEDIVEMVSQKVPRAVNIGELAKAFSALDVE